MSKIIRVKACFQCPYFKSDEMAHNIEDQKYICLNGSPFRGWTGIEMGIIGRYFTDEEMRSMEIPDWCILEDE